MAAPRSMPISKIHFTDANTPLYVSGSITDYRTVETELKRRNRQAGSSFNFSAGLNLSRYLATEIGYLYLPGAPAFGEHSNLIQNSFNAVALMVKGMLPIAHTGMRLFAKVGPSLDFTNTANLATGNGTTGNNQQGGVLYGLGMEYSLNQGLSMSLQYLTASETNLANGVSTSLKSATHNYGVFALNYTL